jgi:subtilisin-like proprotein convertase family protein
MFAEILGTVWHNVDGDGVRDLLDTGLENFTVFLDNDGDGHMDSGELRAVTNDQGEYAFPGLPAGNYTVTQALPPKWKTTSPNGLYYMIDRAANELVTVDRFGTVNVIAAVGVPLGGLAYDSNDDILYGLEPATSTLHEIDRSTGATVPFAALTPAMGVGAALTYNPLDGMLYTVNTTGRLVQIDADRAAATATATVVSGTGLGFAASAVAYNPSDERIYAYDEVLMQAYSYDARTFDGPLPAPIPGGVPFIFGMAHDGDRPVIADGPPWDENIYSYDTNSGASFPLFPTDLLDTRRVTALEFVPSAPVYELTLAAADVLAGIDFANRRTVGDVEGFKWHDQDGDGQRDMDFVSSAHVVFVVDVSSSTTSPWEGATVGDVNGDGTADTILDAELASLIALNQGFIDRGFGADAEIAINVFGDIAATLNLPSVGGYDFSTTSAADLDGNGTPDVADALSTIIEGGTSITSVGLGTDFGVGLAAAQTTFDRWTTSADLLLLVFLSDGGYTGSDFSARVDDLEDRGVVVRAFGVGDAADLSRLIEIDPTADTYDTVDGLSEVYSDLLEYNEPGLPGWTIFLDTNGDATIDRADESVASGVLGTSIAGATTITHSLDVSEISGLISDIDVVLEVTHSQLEHLEVFLTSPSGTRVDLFSNSVLAGSNIIAYFDDQAVQPISASTAPYMGNFAPEGHLADFDLEDPHGVWTLQITDVVGTSGTTNTLNQWGLHIQTEEPSATTDEDGNYQFENLPPGTYEAFEVQQPGWTQSFPGGDGAHIVTVTADSTTDGIDFGNLFDPLAALDFNHDGSYDSDDIDALMAAIAAGTNIITFDLDGDGRVNQTDRDYWLNAAGAINLGPGRAYPLGDANLDGQFDSADLIAVFQAGKFEDQIDDNAVWHEGDWDGDGDFGIGDLVAAFQRGGYEQR